MNEAERKDFVKRIKAKERPTKVRTSFNLDSDVYSRFLEKCQKEGISASQAVLRFMKDFLGEK